MTLTFTCKNEWLHPLSIGMLGQECIVISGIFRNFFPTQSGFSNNSSGINSISATMRPNFFPSKTSTSPCLSPKWHKISSFLQPRMNKIIPVVHWHLPGNGIFKLATSLHLWLTLDRNKATIRSDSDSNDLLLILDYIALSKGTPTGLSTFPMRRDQREISFQFQCHFDMMFDFNKKLYDKIHICDKRKSDNPIRKSYIDYLHLRNNLIYLKNGNTDKKGLPLKITNILSPISSWRWKISSFALSEKSHRRRHLRFKQSGQKKRGNLYSYENCWVAEHGKQSLSPRQLYDDGADYSGLKIPVANRGKSHVWGRSFEFENRNRPGRILRWFGGSQPGTSGQGIGSRLFRFLIEEYVSKKTAPGLLVDKENPTAKKLYLKLGLKKLVILCLPANPWNICRSNIRIFIKCPELVWIRCFHWKIS